MISEKMNKAFNRQINKEIWSAYLYQSMAAKAAALGFDGFEKWFEEQVKEELEHAKKMYEYVFVRGGEVVLETIEASKATWTTPKEMFEDTLKHEKLVTKLINELVDVAEEEKDRAAISFLGWYIEEQVEEETSVEKILNKFENIGENKMATYLLDKEFQSIEVEEE